MPSFQRPYSEKVPFEEANTLVMLGMLAGHAGDVENDADDVDGLAQNTYISREHAVNYSILVAMTEKHNLDPLSNADCFPAKQLACAHQDISFFDFSLGRRLALFNSVFDVQM